MDKRKLSTLARRLEKIARTPVKKRERIFNMSYWWREPDGAMCGTAACALGEATAVPSFKKAGLKIHNGLVFLLPLGVSSPPRDFAYTASTPCGCGAGAAFFGITEQQSFRLFNPDAYTAKRRRGEPIENFVNRLQKSKIGPKRVANRIRGLIAGRWS